MKEQEENTLEASVQRNNKESVENKPGEEKQAPPVNDNRPEEKPTEENSAAENRLEENRAESGKKRWNSATKKLVFIATAEACLLLVISFCWYYYTSHRSVYTEDRDVMVPYYLYLFDEEQTDYFQLQVVNMHPDETKKFIICVSNKGKEEDSSPEYTVGRQSEFNYELEFARTLNVPLLYSVYELQPFHGDAASAEALGKDLLYMDSGTIWERISDDNGAVLPLKLDTEESVRETEENNKEMYGEVSDIVNAGRYDVYKTDARNHLLQLSTTLNGSEVAYEYDYYLVEISWDKSTSIDFSQYLKETDLVYVIVKAVQPRPEVREMGN